MSPWDIMLVQRRFCGHENKNQHQHQHHQGSQKSVWPCHLYNIVSILVILKYWHFCPGVTKKGFLKLYRQDCRVKKLFIESTLCSYFSKWIGSTIKLSNLVVIIILLPFCRGFHAYIIFILGLFWKQLKLVSGQFQ